MSNYVARVLRLNNHIKSLKKKLYFLYLDYALEVLCKLKGFFQSSFPMLPSLQAEVTRFTRIFLSRFVTVESIKVTEDNLTNINLSST